MSWNISATGTKETVKAQLDAGRHHTDGDVDAREYDTVKKFLLSEIDRLADGTGDISISAQGSFPGPNGGARTLSIWISGTGAMRDKRDVSIAPYGPAMAGQPNPQAPAMVGTAGTPSTLGPPGVMPSAQVAAPPPGNPVSNDPHPITSPVTPGQLPSQPQAPLAEAPSTDKKKR